MMPKHREVDIFTLDAASMPRRLNKLKRDQEEAIQCMAIEEDLVKYAVKLVLP